MAQLIVKNLASPGNQGLNTEDAGVDAPIEFAKTALNCVLSKDNRLAARKGLDVITGATLPYTSAVGTIFENINPDGSQTLIWSADNKVFAGFPVMTNITGAASITANDWQFCSLQNTVFAAQRNHTPLAWKLIAGTWTPQVLSLQVDQAAEFPNIAVTAFGRVFTATGSTIKNKVWFSEELNPLNFTTGLSGSLDLSYAMAGGDVIVAMAAIGNKLIFLCRKQIIIYNVDPSVTPFLVLEDVIKGVGCVARDSVVNTGEDLLWLSDQGVVSLGRLISSDGQLPIGDISANVHSSVISDIGATADFSTIKACWWEAEKSYLLLFSNFDKIYNFNLRIKNQRGPVATLWDTLKGTTCIATDINKNIYFGATAKWMTYREYGTSSDSYRLKYYSGFMDFGDPSSFKFLKNISFQVRTQSPQPATVKWGFDYTENFESSSFVVSTGGTSSEYSVAEYGVSEYSSGPMLTDLRSNGSRSGQVLQFGIEADIQGNEFIIYRCEVQATAGKSY
jgi:hypothetical protein